MQSVRLHSCASANAPSGRSVPGCRLASKKSEGPQRIDLAMPISPAIITLNRLRPSFDSCMTVAPTKHRPRCSQARCSAVKNAAALLDPFGTLDPSRGFLPVQDPLTSLTSTLPEAGPWEQALHDIPKLAVAGGSSGVLRRTLRSLPPFPLQPLLQSLQQQQQEQQQLRGQSPGGNQTVDSCAGQPGADADSSMWRAYLVLSFIAHAYMWCEGDQPPSSLPAHIAVPWWTVAKRLDMPPVLVYSMYNLYNWRRLDSSGPVELGNIVCLHVSGWCSSDRQPAHTFG